MDTHVKQCPKQPNNQTTSNKQHTTKNTQQRTKNTQQRTKNKEQRVHIHIYTYTHIHIHIHIHKNKQKKQKQKQNKTKTSNQTNQTNRMAKTCQRISPPVFPDLIATAQQTSILLFCVPPFQQYHSSQIGEVSMMIDLHWICQIPMKCHVSMTFGFSDGSRNFRKFFSVS